jgi:uncharacterized protein YbjT (DUF2867 family)
VAAEHNVQSITHISAIGASNDSLSYYAQSKANGEVRLLEAFPSAVILRPSIVFGPYDDFFNRFASLAMIAPALPLPGGGKMRMQPVYVEDLASAIMASLGFGVSKQVKSPKGKLYEIGGPDIFSFRQLMEMTLMHIKRRRLLLPVPFFAMSCGASIAGLLPNPPITLDQVRLLKSDNIVGGGVRTLSDLGITPTCVDAVLPTYLDRYRPGGLFAAS